MTPAGTTCWTSDEKQLLKFAEFAVVLLLPV